MILKKWLNSRYLKCMNIGLDIPKKKMITETLREVPVIISLTSFPERIKYARETIISLLNQDFLPDRIILWLAPEQFKHGIESVPKEIRELMQYGLDIQWCPDIRAYKKLIPALKKYPDALIVTVDDDWYYSKKFLQILMEEHEKYPEEIICHAITHPDYINGEIKSNNSEVDYRGTSSYLHKLLGGSGVIFPPCSLDEEVFNESVFMDIALTNDDIWIWAMAVKKGTRIRLASRAEGLLLMTHPEVQNEYSLGMVNCESNIYEQLSNDLLERYSEIRDKLKNDSLEK